MEASGTITAHKELSTDLKCLQATSGMRHLYAKPSVKHLKPFGTTAYVGTPYQTRSSKFDPKARKGIMVGYALSTKGYRIWLPEVYKVVETINVSFFENESLQRRSGAVLGPEFSDRPETEPSSNMGPDYILGNPTSSSIISTPVPQLREVTWIRKIVPRKKGTRVDVYYYEEGKTERLRTIKEIRQYCMKHQIKFEPYLFSFKSSNTYEGIVRNSTDSSSSCSSPNLNIDEDS